MRGFFRDLPASWPTSGVSGGVEVADISSVTVRVAKADFRPLRMAEMAWPSGAEGSVVHSWNENMGISWEYVKIQPNNEA
jgi:hypothetical protein